MRFQLPSITRFFILFLTLSCFGFYACNDLEFSNPAFQADINYETWRADAFSATYNGQGQLVITGTNNFETVTLTLNSDIVGTQKLGPDYNSVADYVDGFGTRYSTSVEPDESVSVYRDLGEVEISSIDTASNTFTGSFYFEAFDAEGKNPQGLSAGVFFNVQLKQD